MNNYEFLSNIVKQTRELVNDDKMINKCDMCQGIIGRYLKKLNIPFYACSTEKVITNAITGHSFIVVELDDELYLVDPAFIQFKYDDSEELIVDGKRCISKSPYYYMNYIDSYLTNELITNGFIKLDEEAAYVYGNAFYFTKTGRMIYKLTPISGDIFIKCFKSGKDELRDYGVGEIEDIMKGKVK